MLRRMKRLCQLLVFTSLVLMGSCYRHHGKGIVGSLPPVPDQKAQHDPGLAPSEPREAQRVAEASTPEVTQRIESLTQAKLPPVSEVLLRLMDAYFDLDQYDIRPDSRHALETDSKLIMQILAQDPSLTMVIEGHCDERGSAEYNLALGAMRAEAAKAYLINIGIPEAALKTLSYGKERPQCTAQNEECWQKNRRAHFASVQ